MDQLVNKNQLKEQATEKIRRIIVDVENHLTCVGKLAYDVHSMCETEVEFNEWLDGFSQFSSFVNGAYIRYCRLLTLTGDDTTAELLYDFSDAQLKRFKELSQEQKDEVLNSESSEESLNKFKAKLDDLKAQADKEKKKAVDKAKEEAQKEINDLKEQNEKLQKDLKDKPKKVYPTDYSQAKEKAQQYDRVKAELQELKDKIKRGEIGREDKEKAEERIKELELKIFNLEGIHNTMNKWGLTKDGMENMDDACETVLTYHRKLTKFFDEEVPLNTLNRVASYMIPGMPITVDFISFLDNIIYWAETAKKAIPKSDNTDEPVKYEDCNYVEVKVMEVE